MNSMGGRRCQSNRGLSVSIVAPSITRVVTVVTGLCGHRVTHEDVPCVVAGPCLLSRKDQWTRQKARPDPYIRATIQLGLWKNVYSPSTRLPASSTANRRIKVVDAPHRLSSAGAGITKRALSEGGAHRSAERDELIELFGALAATEKMLLERGLLGRRQPAEPIID